jgi:DNA-binding transcriptional MerR regulator
MKLLDIADVSARTGVAASALRYYEEIGLIASVGRRGLRRQYDADVLLQLQLIAMGRLAGFTLDEIAGMFGATGRPELPRARLHDKADALDRQIRQLAALRDTLRHVAECSAPSHLECPTFRRLLAAAGRHTALRSGRRRPRQAPER